MTNTGGTNVLATLSDREFEVLKLVVKGNDNKQIAVKLEISVETVKKHMRSVLTKLSASSRTQAAVKAFIAGWVNDE